MRSVVLGAGVILGLTLSPLIAQQQPTPTFRSGTRLVPISVVVTDRSGKPVEGLTAADFEIIEGGKKQPVAHFAIERESDAAPSFALAPGRNVFTNVLHGRVGTGATIVLFDRLNTIELDQRWAIKHLARFLTELRPDERVGFYLLDGGGITILHDFTRDVAGFIRMLNRTTKVTSQETDASTRTFDRMAPDESAAIEAKFEEALKRAEEHVQAFFIERRARMTAEALEALTRRLAGIEGRKNVIWVSGGIPLYVRDGIKQEHFGEVFNRATRALSHSDIVIYPVDAGGLKGAFPRPPGNYTGSAVGFANNAFTNLGTVDAAFSTSELLARETGGRVFRNTNDLRAAYSSAMTDARLPYVVGYYPSNETWDGAFRAIDVKVARRGVAVRHRSGYYAHPPLSVDAQYKKSGLLEALAYPIEATAIGLAVAAEAGADAQTGLTIRIDPNTLVLQERGGTWTGTIEIAIAQRMTDGKYANSLDATVPLALPAETRDTLVKEGLTLTRTIALQPGVRQVIVGVRDQTSGAIGTVIIDAARLRTP